jgi:solute carrier family 25 citrate transporter 1
MIGAMAGTVTVYSTMPLDVVKTKMQSLDAQKYKNIFTCVSSVIKEQGVLALWKGATPRLGRLIFSGGIVFTVYEAVIDVHRYLFIK